VSLATIWVRPGFRRKVLAGAAVPPGRVVLSPSPWDR
jgi:hypothetical protein